MEAAGAAAVTDVEPVGTHMILESGGAARVSENRVKVAEFAVVAGLVVGRTVLAAAVGAVGQTVAELAVAEAAVAQVVGSRDRPKLAWLAA